MSKELLDFPNEVPNEVLAKIFYDAPENLLTVILINKRLKALILNPMVQFKLILYAVSHPQVGKRVLDFLKPYVLASELSGEWKYLYSALVAEKIVDDNGKSILDENKLLTSVNFVAPDNEQTRQNPDLMKFRYSILAIISKFPLPEAQGLEVFYNLGEVNFTCNKEHKIIKDICFKGANLKQADFHGMELENIDFSYAHLENAKFSGAARRMIIQNSDFSFSVLCKAKFCGAWLEGLDFSGANLTETFFNADIARAQFKNITYGIVNITTQNKTIGHRMTPVVNFVWSKNMSEIEDFSEHQMKSMFFMVFSAYCSSPNLSSSTISPFKYDSIGDFINDKSYQTMNYGEAVEKFIKRGWNFIDQHKNTFGAVGCFFKNTINAFTADEPLENLTDTDTARFVKKTLQIYKQWESHQAKKKEDKKDKKEDRSAQTSTASASSLSYTQ